MGTNIKLVSGYTGSNTIKLAVDSHEVDGLCFDFESLPVIGNDWLQSNSVNIPLYESRDGKSDAILKQFPNAANAEDLLTDPASKQLLRAATAPTAMSKPLAAPPGLPADRLQALRDAYTATLNDPAFQADATQARLTIVPHSGQQVEQVVNDVLSLDPALGKRLADIRS